MSSSANMSEFAELLENMNWSFVISVGLILLVVYQLYSSMKIVGEYERLAVFMHGRFMKYKGPGLVLIVPTHMKIYRVPLGAQGVLMAENVVRLDGVDFPARVAGDLKLGSNVQITGFDDQHVVVDVASGVQTRKCPECGHEFF